MTMVLLVELVFLQIGGGALLLRLSQHFLGRFNPLPQFPFMSKMLMFLGFLNRKFAALWLFAMVTWLIAVFLLQ